MRDNAKKTGQQIGRSGGASDVVIFVEINVRHSWFAVESAFLGDGYGFQRWVDVGFIFIGRNIVGHFGFEDFGGREGSGFEDNWVGWFYFGF